MKASAGPAHEAAPIRHNDRTRIRRATGFVAGLDAGAEQNRRVAGCADADRPVDDAADAAAGDPDVGDAVPPHSRRAALSAAGAGHANPAVPPGVGGAGAVSTAIHLPPLPAP